MSSRQRPAQGPPSVPLTGFPVRRLAKGTVLFRAHRAELTPWWFGNDASGRFDLRAPRGTCYLAGDAETALRERLGPVLGARAAVPESALEGVVVSALRLAAGTQAADLQSRRAAAFGVTRELETMVPYAVPQAWARAFDAEGFGGVRYSPRFTPGDAYAVALFGAAGALTEAPADASPTPAAQVPGAPVAWPAPRHADLTVVRPPRTRTTGVT